MKIRNGFVSNSSSSSFAIPLSFVTDEQQEVIYSCLYGGRETKIQINEKMPGCFPEEELYPEKGLPVNIEYHNVFQQMIDNEEWDEWGWSSAPHGDFIEGGASMWNGSLGIFFERIGIDITALQIINSGHMTVHMPSNPEALKFFAKKRKEQIEFYNSLDEDAWEKNHFNGPIVDNPYELDNSKFKDFYGDLEFESEDGYLYIKKLKSDTD